MTQTPEEQDADRAYAEFTVGWTFAVWLATGLRLAGERHPEEIKAGLAAVFDLSGYEAEALRIRGLYDRANLRIRKLHDRLAATAQEVERLREEIDRIRLATQPQP